MDDNSPPVAPATLKFLARLVTLLTATMVVGLIVMIGLFVTRFWGDEAGTLALPDSITLPADNRILIYDRQSGSLRQTVSIETQN